MRYAIYARYSSDLQSSASIEDQVRVCRERIEREDGRLVEVYTDAAISGANTINRPGWQQLMADARRGCFDAVMAEALDRISRDQENIAGIFKRLSLIDVRMITLAEGEVSELHIGFKGTMNALFLKDLAAKVKRGQRGRVEVGRVPASMAYGYRCAPKIDAAGKIERGIREIVPEQAAVILRIFEAYANGESARAIAAALNRDGIPSPRGGHWNASTIGGNKKRGNGILYNELYIGRLIYNRQSFRKNPDTATRIGRINSAAEWNVADVPELRIIPDSLWQRVQEVKARYEGRELNTTHRPKNPLSGLVKCGVCGGSFTIWTAGRMKCSRGREAGPSVCDNGQTIYVERLEQRVYSALKEHLLVEEAFAEYCKAYRAAAQELRARQTREQAGAEKLMASLEFKAKRIVNAIGEGTDTGLMRKELIEIEGQLERLRAMHAPQRAARAEKVIPMTPNLDSRYRARLASLQAAFNPEAPNRAEMIEALRGIIEQIKVLPGDGRGDTKLELTGSIMAVIAYALEMPNNTLTVSLVAAEGFEPPTKGL